MYRYDLFKVRGVGRLPLHCGASRRNGVFPANTYQAHACPVLVDRDGTRCAVAHLMGKTGAGDLVLKLGRWDRFVWVEDIEDREVAGWLASVGLTQREAALIQPATYEDGRWSAIGPLHRWQRRRALSTEEDGGQPPLDPDP